MAISARTALDGTRLSPPPERWLCSSPGVTRAGLFLLFVLLVLMLRLANDAHLMGAYRNRRVANVLAWGLTGLVVLTAPL
ncbi:MAG: hypothetical protein SXV54_19650 [Chloroflexota bacterium]|nr:hypothetical protein [Chloroflexota bacterium]